MGIRGVQTGYRGTVRRVRGPPVHDPLIPARRGRRWMTAHSSRRRRGPGPAARKSLFQLDHWQAGESRPGGAARVDLPRAAPGPTMIHPLFIHAYGCQTRPDRRVNPGQARPTVRTIFLPM